MLPERPFGVITQSRVEMVLPAGIMAPLPFSALLICPLYRSTNLPHPLIEFLRNHRPLDILAQLRHYFSQLVVLLHPGNTYLFVPKALTAHLLNRVCLHAWQ